MMRNGDTTAVVVKATKLFDPSNKDVLDVKALLYGENRGLINPSVKGELSSNGRAVRYGNAHLGLARELTIEGDDGTYSRNSVAGSGSKGRISGTFVTLLSLVPDREIPIRKAVAEVGVRRQAYTDYSSTRGVRKEFDSVRWNIAPGDHITVYIDTLFPVTRREAIGRGVEAWNAGFRQAGLGDVVVAVPYPRDSCFCADDPFICKVVPTRCNVDLIMSSIFGSGLTGGVLGATITIPDGYLTQAWHHYAYAISEADPRFRTLFPCEEARCEILQAVVMRQFGAVLGLSDNLCGSAAYSPEQLRDPGFTASHGITASVMDVGAMYNTLARPGDRERGVPTISNQIGTYDKFAIEWLYRVFPSGTDVEAALKAMVASHQGDPEYLYLGLDGSWTNAKDVRARSGDLGNDPMEEYRSRMSTLKYVAQNSFDWLLDPRLDGPSDRELFFEWIWLSMADATHLLTPYLGGVKTNPIESGMPKYTPVDKKLQKEYIRTLFSTWRDYGWMGVNRDLVYLSGPYVLEPFTNINSVNMTGARNRLPYVVLAWKDAGSNYPPSEYLDDVEAEVFRNVRQGRLEPQEEMAIGMYMTQALINNSPVLKMNYDMEADPHPSKLGLMSTEDLYAPLVGVPTTYIEEMDILSKQHLEKCLAMLRQGRSRASDANVRGKIDFLIRVAETALNSDNN
jgi:hypothetical protein